MPAHILILIAFALWLGRQAGDAIRRAVISFAVALIAGLIAGTLRSLPPAIPLAAALLCGTLAAWGPQLSARVAAMIAVTVAALIGFDTAEDDVAAASGVWTGAHLIVLNVENAAAGFSITASTAQELFAAGVDVMTSGNHIFDKKDALELIKNEPRLLRPINYVPTLPGSGRVRFSDGRKSAPTSHVVQAHSNHIAGHTDIDGSRPDGEVDRVARGDAKPERRGLP